MLLCLLVLLCRRCFVVVGVERGVVVVMCYIGSVLVSCLSSLVVLGEMQLRMAVVTLCFVSFR